MKGAKKMIKILTTIICAVLLPVFAGDVGNQPIHWGFKKNYHETQPTIEKNVTDLLSKYNSFHVGNSSKKEVYLTFDNGYENGYTSKILDVLKNKKVPAAFFVTGHYLDSAADLVKRMVNEGHIIGNHSWSHPDFTQISDTHLKGELEKVRLKTKELTGQKEMHYLRPPQGVFNERTLFVSKQLGYRNVFWSVAFVDWNVKSQKGWKYAYDHVIKQIHPGAVILLHAVSKDNAEALDKIIDDLRKQGYTFKSLDALK